MSERTKNLNLGGASRSEKRGGERYFWFPLAIVASLILRISFLNFESSDYKEYLSQWYDFFVAHGRWSGLHERFAYPPLYMYFLSLSTLLPWPKLYSIKMISIASDYLAAYYIWRIAQYCLPTTRREPLAVTVFLFLPTVILNSAVWGQCDIMYTTGFVASLLYVIEKRPIATLIAFGISCSLKPQAVFWCPLLAGLFAARLLPWRYFWIPVIVYVCSFVPSVMAGRDVFEALGYCITVRDRPGLVHGSPNWYQWLDTQTHEPLLFWLGMVLAVVGGLFYVWLAKVVLSQNRDSPKIFVELALLSVLFPPFLLPSMHDRYFFPADVFSVIYVICGVPIVIAWYPTVLIQCASIAAYSAFLFQKEFVPNSGSAFLILFALVFVVVQLLREIRVQRRSPARRH